MDLSMWILLVGILVQLALINIRLTEIGKAMP